MLLLRYVTYSILKAAVSIVFVLANFLSILQLAILSLHHPPNISFLFYCPDDCIRYCRNI